MQIVIAACGWTHPQWHSQFYPDDMPAEWRLGYYANEFDAVLIPYSYWSLKSPADIENWFDEVPENFDLFFEIDEAVNAESVKKLLPPQVNINQCVRFSVKSVNQCFSNASLFEGEPLFPSVCVKNIATLKISSQDVIKVDEIRQILERAKEDYAEFGQMHVFFDHALLDMNVMNAAKIIVDLSTAADY